MRPSTVTLIIVVSGLLVWWLWRALTLKRARDPADGHDGWVSTRGAKVKIPNQDEEEWGIREATFLYQTRGLDAKPCYLEANGVSDAQGAGAASRKQFGSPMAPPGPVAIALPDDFMKRIGKTRPNAKPGAACEVTAEGVVEKQTGQAGGYLFTVSDIHWISPTDVEVTGGLCVGANASTSKTYYLKKADAQWRVVGEHMKSISCG